MREGISSLLDRHRPDVVIVFAYVLDIARL